MDLGVCTLIDLCYPTQRLKVDLIYILYMAQSSPYHVKDFVIRSCRGQPDSPNVYSKYGSASASTTSGSQPPFFKSWISPWGGDLDGIGMDFRGLVKLLQFYFPVVLQSDEVRSTNNADMRCFPYVDIRSLVMTTTKVSRGIVNILQIRI